jgi:CDP-diacylglycerol--glycerol-3-phosphate 3-phosphatidyltransferase
MTFATRVTLFRLVIAVIVLPFFYMSTEVGYLVTMFLFLLAVFTDILDGYIARRFNQHSNFGARLDALVDKTIMYALLFSLFYMRTYNPFLLFSMFFRDMIVDGLRNAVHYSYGTIPSNTWGKSKFFFQSASVLLGLAYCIDPAHLEWLWLANITLAIAFGVSIPGLWIVIMSTLGALERGKPAIATSFNSVSDVRQ